LTDCCDIANVIAHKEHAMEQLLELVRKYCQQRNLVESCYIQGMTTGQSLEAGTIATLIRYHQEWLKN
jgi:hypothetical protein